MSLRLNRIESVVSEPLLLLLKLFFPLRGSIAASSKNRTNSAVFLYTSFSNRSLDAAKRNQGLLFITTNFDDIIYME